MLKNIVKHNCLHTLSVRKTKIFNLDQDSMLRFKGVCLLIKMIIGQIVNVKILTIKL